MKSLLTFVLAGLIAIPAFTQEDSAANGNSENVTIIEAPEAPEEIVEPEAPEVIVDSESSVIVIENQDTTRIKIGKKGISIIEGGKGTQFNIDDLNDDEDDDDDADNGKFKPNWTGFELGLNNYVNSDLSMSLDNTMNFMDLNTSRSWNVNINFMQYGFGIIGDKIGIVTGLGAEWNNYHFDNNNNIQKVNGVIEPLDLTYADIQKNRLQTTYLRAPLLLEFQIPAGSKRIYLSAGPVAGVKLFSNTKIVYKDRGDKQKIKDKDDYNISPLRYGFTARAGYRGLRLFANYYMTPLFEANKGPELYPFSVGLTLLDF